MLVTYADILLLLDFWLRIHLVSLALTCWWCQGPRKRESMLISRQFTALLPFHALTGCGTTSFLACSRLRDSRVRWIEKAQTPAPGIPSDWSDLTDYQHSQSGSLLSLKEMASGVDAREIEESSITSCVERMFTRFPAHRSAEEGTEDLPCELGAWKRCFCNLADRLRSCLITKW